MHRRCRCRELLRKCDIPSILTLPVLISIGSALWSNNLLDADKTLQTFFDSCFAGGPDLCPFYDSSPQAISRKLDDLTRTITLRPIPVVTNISYGLVDYARLRGAIGLSLYSPYVDFPRLARGLADLSQGDGTGIYQMLETEPLFDCHCGDTAPLSTIQDARAAISCTDGQEVRDTVDELEVFVRDLLRTSQWGEFWAILRIECTYVRLRMCPRATSLTLVVVS